MSGIGFSEMLMLAIIALIVVGPQRLPGIARSLGKLSRQARNAWQGLQSELQAELDLEHNRKIMQASQSESKPAASSTQEPAADESDTATPATDATHTHSSDEPDSRRNEK